MKTRRSNLRAVACAFAVLLVVGCGGSSGSSAKRVATGGGPSAGSSSTPFAKHYVPQPMPSGPVALSVSWQSRAHGWLAAAEPCGTSQCVVLYATSNAGRRWNLVATPRLRLTQPAGVLLVDGQIGYLFSGGLLMTRDGGQTWTRESLPNVSALAQAGPSVVALTYDHSGCPGPCDVRIARATVGGNSWATLTAGSRPDAYVALSGTTGALVAIEPGDRASASPRGALAVSTDGGVSWRQFGDPCRRQQQREYDLVDAAAVAGVITALCGSHVGDDRNYVMTSPGEGRSWGSVEWVPSSGLGHVTAFGDGGVLVATAGSSGTGEGVYRVIGSARSGSAWQALLSATEPLYDQPEMLAGVSRLDRSSAKLLTYIADGVHVWRSDDGGQTWHPLLLP